MATESQRDMGFSIVELVVTLAIAGTAVSIVMGIYSISNRLADRSYDLLTANEIAYSKLQQFENEPYSEIPVTTTSDTGTVIDATKYEEDFAATLPQTLPKPYDAKVFISNVGETTTLKYILVRLKYGEGGQQQIVEYGSLVQEGGLGR